MIKKKAEGRGQGAEGNIKAAGAEKEKSKAQETLFTAFYSLLALKRILLSLMFTCVLFLSPAKGEEANSKNFFSTLVKLDTSTARSQATKLYLYPGRNTVIDFSATNEVIFSIKIGDPSKTVYNTDVPLDKGTAKSLYLTPIQKLNFPGATITKVTNLIIKTVDKNTNQQQIYIFDLYHKNEQVPGINGVAINSEALEADEPKEDPLIWRVDNRIATLDDIEQGLRVAIMKGWTSPLDEEVAKIREFLAIAHNTPKITLTEAATRVGLDLSVVSSLAKIGLDFRFELPTEVKLPNN